MKKYKAYKVILFPYVDGSYSVHWGIRAPGARHHYSHRVGGPAYVRYSPDGRALAQTWGLDGTAYYTTHEYQKALEEWLG